MGWKLRPIRKIKINMDGAVKGNPRTTEADCLLRDEHGKWIVGVARNLGITISIRQSYREYCKVSI